MGFRDPPGTAAQRAGTGRHHRHELGQLLLAGCMLPGGQCRVYSAAAGRRQAFVPFPGGSLDDILCEQFERTAGKDNCVRFEGLMLQIPSDRQPMPLHQGQSAYTSPSRRHTGGFSRPRQLAAYKVQGAYIQPEIKAIASLRFATAVPGNGTGIPPD